MSIKEMVRLQVWTRAHGLCSFTNCRENLEVSEGNSTSLFGIIAHIVARSESGPRGKEEVRDEERASVENLILLCPKHHKLVDDNPDEFTSEKLREMKESHELWVKEHFADDNNEETLKYANYLDVINELLDIDNFTAWTSYLVSGSTVVINIDHYQKIEKIGHYIITRQYFSQFGDIEKAFINIKNVINDLLLVFDEYKIKLPDGRYQFEKFYKKDFVYKLEPEAQEKFLQNYEFKIQLIQNLVFELAKSYNWLIDCVRRNINKSYRLEEGYLTISHGPYTAKLTYYNEVFKYSKDEIIELYKGLEEIEKKTSQTFLNKQNT